MPLIPNSTSNFTFYSLFLGAVLLCVQTCVSASISDSIVGNWALTLPKDKAGWLGVSKEEEKYKAQILWGGGSVVPVINVKEVGDSLHFTLPRKPKKSKDGTEKPSPQLALTAKINGDRMDMTVVGVLEGKIQGEPVPFDGKRIPAHPSRPDLGSLQFRDPVQLFNGMNLDGWETMNPNDKNGWSVKDGLLVNKVPLRKPGTPRIRYQNLRTVKEFEDFNLSLEVKVPKNGNSGIYLRGIYEVQVFDTFGKELDSHHMGAIYSRITPSVSAEKPAGEWQQLDITLVDRHVNVILNGITIIANQPLMGCTGGALWSDEFRPGPIYLQGDHTSASYRNIVIRPVIGRIE